MPEWIGETIGRVRIEKLLARGGMAEVYLGTHLTLERPVAVKLLHSYIEEDPLLLERFHREAKVVAGLRHPNIVQIFDFATVDGHPYLVMEYLKGPTLATYLRHQHQRKKRIAFDQVARLLHELSAALDYAHQQGVIHRDIKPGNILLHDKSNDISLDKPLTNSVEAIIADFGLVRIMHMAPQTTSGSVSGTPAYMSPEQARGDQLDHRTDIYSLGIVLYEMLAGRVPFETDNTVTILHMQMYTAPPRIPGIPREVQAVIDRVLQKNPEDRYQTGQEMALDFDRSIGMSSPAEASLGPPVSAVSIEESGAAAVSSSPEQTPPLTPPQNWARIGIGLFSLVLLSILAAWGWGNLRSRPVIVGMEPSQTAQIQSTLKQDTPTSVSTATLLNTAVITSTPTLVKTETPKPVAPIQKIDFDYEDSPTKHGWEMLAREATEEEIQIEHTYDQLVGNGITITSAIRYGMEFKVGPEAAQRGTAIELVANLTEDASFFAYISLVQEDGSTSKGWLKLKSIKGPPQQVDNDEWQLSIEPVSSKGADWSLYQVHLPSAVMQTFGKNGWKFQQLEKFRIRGNLSLGYIYIYETLQ